MIDPASIAALLSKLKASQAAAATTAGTTASSAAAAPIVNKSMTTAAINAGASNAPAAAAPLSASGIPPMPVSAISQAPAQLAAQQASGINNIGSALSSGSSNLAAISAPTNIASGPTPIPQGTPKQNFQETLAQYSSDKIQHHPLVTSRAQFTPINTDRTNPFRKASLFDMLQEMYGV